MNYRLPELEYESPYLPINMGSMVLLLAISLGLLFLYMLMTIVCCCRKWREYGKRQVRKTFWNGILGFMDGALIVFIFGS